MPKFTALLVMYQAVSVEAENKYRAEVEIREYLQQTYPSLGSFDIRFDDNGTTSQDS